MQKNNWKPEEFAAKETKEERSISSSIDGIHSENVKPGEKHLLSNVIVHSLQNRVNNFSIEKRKTAFARFKVKKRNRFTLALINTGNLEHCAIDSGEFWEAIGGQISNSQE